SACLSSLRFLLVRSFLHTLFPYTTLFRSLLQGVVNTFVVFLARIVAFAVTRFVNENLAPLVHILAIIVFQLIFSVLGSLVVFAYSRHREFHADRGGADLAGKDKMRHALDMLKQYAD